MNEKNYIVFLEHILDNVEKVESFSGNVSKDELNNDELRQYAIVRAIEIIGEAVKNLPSSFKNKHSNISWRDIVGTRDKMIHHYFGVDLNIVWGIVKKDIPKLKKEVKDILEKEKKKQIK